MNETESKNSPEVAQVNQNNQSSQPKTEGTEKKKMSKGVLIAIIVAVLLLLPLCCCGTYFMYFGAISAGGIQQGNFMERFLDIYEEQSEMVDERTDEFNEQRDEILDQIDQIEEQSDEFAEDFGEAAPAEPIEVLQLGLVNSTDTYEVTLIQQAYRDGFLELEVELANKTSEPMVFEADFMSVEVYLLGSETPLTYEFFNITGEDYFTPSSLVEANSSTTGRYTFSGMDEGLMPYRFVIGVPRSAYDFEPAEGEISIEVDPSVF